MKKLIFLFTLCLLLAGCTRKNEPVTLPAPEPATRPIVQTNWIQPLPSAIDLENLGDCTLSVSLQEGDIYTDDTGVTQMKLTVYDYDRYGAADVAALRVGDTITIDGENVVVKELNVDAYGAVAINGGLDGDGYSLVTYEDTTYHRLLENDSKDYHEVGNITVPVDESFIYNDLSAEKPAVYTVSDLLSGKAEYSFYPQNTTVRLEKGQAVEMTRIFVP